jgi:hypothetical protein
MGGAHLAKVVDGGGTLGASQHRPGVKTGKIRADGRPITVKKIWSYNSRKNEIDVSGNIDA